MITFFSIVGSVFFPIPEIGFDVPKTLSFSIKEIKSLYKSEKKTQPHQNVLESVHMTLYQLVKEQDGDPASSQRPSEAQVLCTALFLRSGHSPQDDRPCSRRTQSTRAHSP